MPLPMVHLAVVVAMAERDATFPSPELLLGSLAPDAIHMRPGTDRHDKMRVHLREEAEGAEPPVGRILLAHEQAPEPLRELAKGYALHLLTDWLWLHDVVADLRTTLGPVSLETLRTVYYQDLDPIDVWLYQTRPWQPRVWGALAAAQPFDLPDLLTAQEIDGWRHRTLGWYDEYLGGDLPEPRYVTHEAVERFVAQAARELPAMLARLCEKAVGEAEKGR